MSDAIRVGVLDDLVDGPPSPNDTAIWVELAVAELSAAGRIDVPVTVMHAHGLGLPYGSTAAVERAFQQLAAEGVVVIVGPAIGDNALFATPLVERARIPTINWAGTERGRGSYMFQLQVGSHEDESIVISEHLVYLGFGAAAAKVSEALDAAGWEGRRVMNTAGIRGHHGDLAREIDGWTYLDMYADDNATLAGLLRRTDLPEGGPFQLAKGYDLGRLVAEGIARAPELSPEGLREGLERVKWLPAAQGHDGTLLGFGNHDRGALHGRYLVTRRWADGTSVQV